MPWPGSTRTGKTTRTRRTTATRAGSSRWKLSCAWPGRGRRRSPCSKPRARTPGFLPLLLKALNDDENRVRNAAAVTLGSFEKHKDAVLPPLSEALKDKDAWVRLGAVQSIRRLNPGDGRLAGVLIGILKEGDPDLRKEAAATR